MIIKRQVGESFAAYQKRYQEQSDLLEGLYTHAKVLDALIAVSRDVYTDESWHWEGERLKKIIARQVVDDCREIAALWGMVPPKTEGEDPNELPF